MKREFSVAIVFKRDLVRRKKKEITDHANPEGNGPQHSKEAQEAQRKEKGVTLSTELFRGWQKRICGMQLSTDSGE